MRAFEISSTIVDFDPTLAYAKVTGCDYWPRERQE